MAYLYTYRKRHWNLLSGYFADFDAATVSPNTTGRRSASKKLKCNPGAVRRTQKMKGNAQLPRGRRLRVC